MIPTLADVEGLHKVVQAYADSHGISADIMNFKKVMPAQGDPVIAKRDLLGARIHLPRRLATAHEVPFQQSVRILGGPTPPKIPTMFGTSRFGRRSSPSCTSTGCT